jgi:NAD(P)H-dependent flavin oxidoreductase YrpB (nitropropane dioxygenase family)
MTSPTWHERLGIEHPVLQAGMGGGVVGPELAAAVSRAGGMGTIGNLGPASFARAIRRAKELAGGGPIAANLLLPFVQDGHVEACLSERPAVTSLFFGFSRGTVRRLREVGIFVLHQVGTPAEALRALEDGADGLIVQGREAGGHLLGTMALVDALRLIVPMAAGRPVIAAGGVHDEASAARAAENGASGVAAGTRFLLTSESGAHPAYQERLLAAQRTLVTKLFGLAWPADHRVVPNRATERWCAGRDEGPPWVRAMNELSVPLRRFTSPALRAAMMARQSVGWPVYSPQPITAGMDARLADVTPLYAGACVSQIRSVASAASVVAELAEGFAWGVT